MNDGEQATQRWMMKPPGTPRVEELTTILANSGIQRGKRRVHTAFRFTGQHAPCHQTYSLPPGEAGEKTGP